MNYPKRVTASSILGSIDYVYTAMGEKLEAKYKWHSGLSLYPAQNAGKPSYTVPNKELTKQYIGNKIYENGQMKKILIENGYIEGGIYYFYLKDHLGNNSMVANAGGQVIQSTLYYPFGSPVTNGESMGQEKQPYKFGEKEFDTMNGLNLYDFHARQYDSALGRFTSMDPLAEKYYSTSPYAYCLNNPLKYIDPTGMWIKDKDGNLVAENGDSDKTLAKYLNTTAEIAQNMMLEQFLNLSDNKDENKEVDKGDIFEIGNDRYGDKVGGLGGDIQSYAGSQFSKDMFWNYWHGKGDVKLRGQRFASILMYLKENGVEVPQKAGGKVVSFYESSEYARVFGRATVYYNASGQVTGFYDNYDFDSKSWGERSFKNEFITRTVDFFSTKKSKPFKITYGQ
ncbi:RHS repeat-associated core domain-containing protein [Dysgonomonas sp. 216]|uniref:RHS repeat domain-containing protein n=1 Tax=Dysgonomonas sp. 216 TaxID=2302934 RepID=UPI0013D146FE|nr:RHS repeat-associated core domain-containing protein [Dysgonomonas sp. 216]NDW19461.1 RHS repeat-associated core domain-containing protein [Dysgonomonas sp. 216]